jgi:hypothetical protein
MKNFWEYVESIYDPKRNPKASNWEKSGEHDPADDDYNPPDPFFDDDDDNHYHRSQLGKTAQYPLAKSAGKMRGFQVRSPEQQFNSKDKQTSYRDIIDTLKSKNKAGEDMSWKEINFLIKHLDKEIAGEI